jgi:epoxyqueuosine reductase
MADLVGALAEEARAEGLVSWSFCPARAGHGVSGPALVALMPFEALADDALPEAMAGRGGYARPAFIAPFARANYYKALARSLARVARAAARRAGIALESFRVSVNSNSGIDERFLALEAGLGVIGRNGLLASPRHGSLCVIGALMLPADTPLPDALALGGAAPAPPEPGALCGSCRNCVDACPTGALGGPRGFDRARCIQHYAGIPGALPKYIEEAWGPRLYGCRACQAVCPLNKHPSEARATKLGSLPPAIEAEELEGASDAELKARFKGTSLGMGFISPEALRRNARLARLYWEGRIRK